MFRSWQARDAPLLWICGRPGCGKSVLASSIIHHLRTQRDCFVAYAFSDKQDERRQSSAALVRTILWQILTSGRLSTSDKLDIIHDYRRSSGCRSTNYGGTIQDGFEYISSLFGRYACLLSQFTIIIDGLDECHDPERLLKTMTNSAFLQKSNISIGITSQVLPSITRYLETSALKIDMEDAAVRHATDQDIRHYIRTELADCHRPLITKHLDTIVDLIATKANGMFLWAAIAVPEVCTKAIIHDGAKDQFFESVQSIPENLATTLEYLLNRILQYDLSLGPRLNEKREAMLVRILQWAFHASRPLAVDEMQAALRIADAFPSSVITVKQHEPSTFSDIDMLLKMCYPLLYTSSRTIHIMHSSLTAFVLPGADHAPSEKVTKKLGDASFQSVLAARCLTYLSQPQMKDFITCSEDRELFRRYPLWKYAISSWVPHLLKDPKPGASIKEQVAKFLESSHAVTWLEQWHGLNIGTFDDLQSQLYGYKSCVEDPQWILKVLSSSTEARLRTAPDSLFTRAIVIQLGRLYRFHGMAYNAERTLSRLYEKQRLHLTPKDALLRITMSDLAGTYCDLEKLPEAKELYDEILGSLSDEDAREAITVSGNLAVLYSMMGEAVRARELSFKVLNQSRIMYGPLHVKTAHAHSNFAGICQQLADFALAKDHSEKALEQYTQLRGEDSLEALTAMDKLAISESALQNHGRAAELSKHVWKTRSTLLGESHPETLLSGNNHASNLMELTRFGEATVLLETQLQHWLELKGEAHRFTISAMGTLATSLEQQGRHEESTRLQEKVFATRLTTLGQRHRHTLHAMNNLALKYQAAYDYTKAEELLAKCYQLHSKTLGAEHDSTIAVRGNLATTCSFRDRYSLTTRLASRNILLTKGKYGEKHQKYVLRQQQLANVMRELGRYSESERLLESVLKTCSREGIKERSIFLLSKLELSATYRGLGLYTKAEKIALEVLEYPGLVDDDKRGRSWLIPYAQQQLGLALQKQGVNDRAHELFQQALDYQIKRFGANSKGVLPSQCYLASAQLKLGRAQLAERTISLVADAWSTMFGRDHSLTGLALDLQARCCQTQRRYHEAEALQIQAMMSRQIGLGPRHLYTLQMKHNYAMLLRDMGAIEEAERLMCETLRDQKLFLRDGHPDTNESAVDLANIQSCRGSKGLSEAALLPVTHDPHDQPEQNLLQTLSEACIVLGPTDLETLAIKRDIALSQKRAQQLVRARTMLEDLLIEYINVHSACHVETLTTLIELMDLIGDSTRLREGQFDQCLIRAIREKDVNLLQKLLQHGASTAEQDAATGISAFGLAIDVGNEEIISCLLNYKFDVNSSEPDGSTALHRASSQGSYKVVKLLLESEADPNVLDSKRATSPLYLPCLKGRTEVVNALLGGGANPNTSEDLPPLHTAAVHNQAAIVECLLQNGAIIESPSKDGMTPIMLAAANGHLSMVKLLEERGANVKSISSNGAGALHWACIYGRPETIAYLITRGFDPNEPMRSRGLRPLNLAAQKGNFEVFEALFLGGATLNLQAEDKAAMTPLASAARWGNIDFLGCILREDNAMLNKQTGESQCLPLHYAAAYGQLEAVDKLIEAGADLNVVTRSGNTPLIEAVIGSRLLVAERLISAGTDLSLGKPGSTALEAAFTKSEIPLIKVLVSCPRTELNAPLFSN